MRALLINLQLELLTTFWKLSDAHVNKDAIVGGAAISATVIRWLFCRQGFAFLRKRKKKEFNCCRCFAFTLTQVAIFTLNSQRIPNKVFQKADKPPFLNYS